METAYQLESSSNTFSQGGYGQENTYYQGWKYTGTCLGHYMRPTSHFI